METETLNALHKLATEAIRSKRLADAQNVLRKALVIDNRNVMTYLLLTYTLVGNPTKQRQALAYAKRIAPTDPRVLRRERELYSQMTRVSTTPVPESSAPAIIPVPSHEQSTSTKPPTTDSAPQTAPSPESLSINQRALPLLIGGVILLLLLVARRRVHNHARQ